MIALKKLKEGDFAEVKSIYDYYIENSTATFHTEPMEIDALKESILIDHPKYASFRIEYENEFAGFAYLGRYKARQAYDRTAEVTIYLKPEFGGKGIGKYVLSWMEQVAKDNGISVLLGVITAENRSSTALFERQNYEKCAHFKAVGEKFGRVLDVVAYQKILS